MSIHEETLAKLLTKYKFPPFEREHLFHPTRKWRFDFAWTELKVVAEVEGGIYGADAGHRSITRYKQDIDKYNEAAIHGWLVVRVTSDMLGNGKAIELLGRALTGREDLLKEPEYA